MNSLFRNGESPNYPPGAGFGDLQRVFRPGPDIGSPYRKIRDEQPGSSFPRVQPRMPAVGQSYSVRPSAAAKFIVKLIHVWRLSEEDTAQILGFESQSQAHSFLKGYFSPSGRDWRERVKNLLAIKSSLSALFRDPRAEVDWLRASHEQLGGKSPLHLFQEGSMEGLITVRQFTDWLSGR